MFCWASYWVGLLGNIEHIPFQWHDQTNSWQNREVGNANAEHTWHECLHQKNAKNQCTDEDIHIK
jgi:hypothetical protein